MWRDRPYLLDILEVSQAISSLRSGQDRKEFFADIQCQDAVIRPLEIIGEAARRVPEQTRAALPSIPWARMVAMRNVMIHEYDSVDLSVVWRTVHCSLPSLIAELERAIDPD